MFPNKKEIGTKFEANGFGAGLALFHTDKPRSLYVAESNNTARFTSEAKTATGARKSPFMGKSHKV